MNETICFNQNIFLISIIVLTIIIMSFNKLFNENNLSCPVCPSCPINSNNNTQNENKIYNDNKINDINNIIYKPLVDKLIDKRDEESYNNPLKAPFRRNERHVYPTNIRDYIEYPSRGYPDNFHYIGNLVRKLEDKTEFVKLFGRQTYPGSHLYEYYGITSDNYGGSQIKFQIKTNNKKQIYDGDDVYIDELDNNKGSFKFYENEYDKPRYNPFIIN